MSAKIRSLPGTFPVQENRAFLSESEWVILKLLCRTVDSLAGADAKELSAASGGQLSLSRCRELINIVRISRMPGLGTWIARLLSEAGLSEVDVRTLAAGDIVDRVNTQAGYPICNRATMHAIAALQEEWGGVKKSRTTNE